MRARRRVGRRWGRSPAATNDLQASKPQQPFAVLDCCNQTEVRVRAGSMATGAQGIPTDFCCSRVTGRQPPAQTHIHVPAPPPPSPAPLHPSTPLSLLGLSNALQHHQAWAKRITRPGQNKLGHHLASAMHSSASCFSSASSSAVAFILAALLSSMGRPCSGVCGGGCHGSSVDDVGWESRMDKSSSSIGW